MKQKEKRNINLLINRVGNEFRKTYKP